MSVGSENFDLIFEKKTKLSIEQIWKAWTDPMLLMKWFCPRPWRVTDCRIELKTGGEFFTVMSSPEGQEFPNNGIFLEVIENEKLIWTNMMSKGYQPVSDEKMGFSFVVILELFQEHAHGQKETRYLATVKHPNEASRKKHEQMGFHEGWGMAFQQLEELMR